MYCLQGSEVFACKIQGYTRSSVPSILGWEARALRLSTRELGSSRKLRSCFFAFLSREEDVGCLTIFIVYIYSCQLPRSHQRARFNSHHSTCREIDDKIHWRNTVGKLAFQTKLFSERKDAYHETSYPR